MGFCWKKVTISLVSRSIWQMRGTLELEKTTSRNLSKTKVALMKFHWISFVKIAVEVWCCSLSVRVNASNAGQRRRPGHGIAEAETRKARRIEKAVPSISGTYLAERRRVTLWKKIKAKLRRGPPHRSLRSHYHTLSFWRIFYSESNKPIGV